MITSVKTTSGAEYEIRRHAATGALQARKGARWATCVAIRPELLPNLLDTVRVEQEGAFHCGYNRAGNRTMRVKPTDIRKGYILANRRGFRSTPIVALTHE